MAARSGCLFPTSGGMVASKIQDVVAPFAQAAGEAMRCGHRREKSFKAECDRNRPLVAVGRSYYLRICSVMCMRGISERIVDHDKDVPEPHGSTLAKKLLAQWSGQSIQARFSHSQTPRLSRNLFALLNTELGVKLLASIALCTPHDGHSCFPRDVSRCATASSDATKRTQHRFPTRILLTCRGTVYMLVFGICKRVSVGFTTHSTA